MTERDCCTNLTAKVATLEANQNHITETLEDVVKDMKGIVLDLAQRKGAEKLALAAFGGLLTVLGAVAEHIVHR